MQISNQNNSITNLCDIKKGAPEPTLTWEKDGNVLASNSKDRLKKGTFKLTKYLLPLPLLKPL